MIHDFSNTFAFKITNNFQQLSEPKKIKITIDSVNVINKIDVSSTKIIPDNYNYGLEIYDNSTISIKQ